MAGFVQSDYIIQSKKWLDKQESKIDCAVECPLKSYWECKECKHNKSRE